MAEAIGDLIGNKIAVRIAKVSKTLPQNNSETKKHDQKIRKERYISPGENSKLLIIWD